MKTAELGATKRLVNMRMFIWKIGDFGQVLKQVMNKRKEVLEIDPFYSANTESFGYKYQVRVNPNDCESGQTSHHSVFITLKRGDYDAILPTGVDPG